MSGLPVWYELMTPDPAAVSDFYRETLGWRVPATGNELPNGARYAMIGRADGGNAGGMLTLTPQMCEQGARAGWIVYFEVDDVDAAVDAITAKGGHAPMPATTMDVGRMAMVSDPQGAHFYVMAPVPPEGGVDPDGAVFKGDTVGRATWNELNTDAAEEQIAFYTDLFDWQVSGEMPMPGDHIYKFLDLGERGIGAIGSMKPEGMPNAWLPYFRVADIDAAKAAVEAHGGSVVMGPYEVPDGDSILVATDPAGAAVGLVGRTK